MSVIADAAIGNRPYCASFSAIQNYNPANARRMFIDEKEKVLDGYFKDELAKHTNMENMREKAAEEGAALLMQHFVPYVDNERKKWNDRIVDDMQIKSPTILDMVIAVCPYLVDIDCLVNTDKYLKWMTEDFNRPDSPLVYLYTRKITPEQRHQHMNEHVEINIELRKVLIP